MPPRSSPTPAAPCRPTVVGYDHETGFGLLRTLEPLKIKPLAFGKSADLKEQDPALVVSFGGAGMVLPVHVVSRREFAGSWEYLVDGAIFTAPAASGLERRRPDQPRGQAGRRRLADRRRRQRREQPDARQHVRADRSAVADPRRSARQRPGVGAGQPWLGVNASDVGGRLIVGRVSPEEPGRASRAPPRRHHRRRQRREDCARCRSSTASSGRSVRPA